MKLKSLLLLLLMLPVTIASDCGRSEELIYFEIRTLVTQLNAQGRPFQFGVHGVQVTGRHVRDRSDLGVVKGNNTAVDYVSRGSDFISDGRAAADWRFGENNGPCAGQSIVFPIVQKERVPLNCDMTGGIAFPFRAAPDEINLHSPPSGVTITGTGMQTTHGMPVVDFYDENGNLAARTSAYEVSWDGTILRATTPDMSQAGTGSFILFVSNVNADGTVSQIGSLSIFVYIPEPPPPPPPDPEPCNPYCMIY